MPEASPSLFCRPSQLACVAGRPLCHVEHLRAYPRDLMPKGEPTRYPDSGQPGENRFELKRPEDLRKDLMEPKKEEPKKEELPLPMFAEDLPPPPPAKLGPPGK